MGLFVLIYKDKTYSLNQEDNSWEFLNFFF